MVARIAGPIGEIVPRNDVVDAEDAVTSRTASAAAAAQQATMRMSRDGRIRTGGLLLPKQAR